MSGGLERAREDVAAGRLWKARDRLTGLRASRPYDQEVLELLGSVSFDMGDLPAAGLAWFLTEGDHPGREAALAAMHERYPTADALAQALKLRGRIEGFSQDVQERVRELARIGGPTARAAAGYQPGAGDAVTVFGCGGLAVAAAIVPWVVGIVVVIKELL